jgi:lauroyl/myristoyl acyltransferase
MRLLCSVGGDVLLQAVFLGWFGVCAASLFALLFGVLLLCRYLPIPYKKRLSAALGTYPLPYI